MPTKTTNWRDVAAEFMRIVTRKAGSRAKLSSKLIIVRSAETAEPSVTLFEVFKSFYPDCPLTEDQFWDTVGRRLFKGSSPQGLRMVRYNGSKSKYFPFASVRKMATAQTQCGVKSELKTVANMALPAKMVVDAGMASLVDFRRRCRVRTRR